MKHKTCNKCDEEKPIHRFSPTKNTPDGFLNSCRNCVAEASRKWRRVNVGKSNPDNAWARGSFEIAFKKTKKDTTVLSERVFRLDFPSSTEKPTPIIT